MSITRRLLPALAFALLIPVSAVPAKAADPALQALIDGPQRSEKNSARDKYRHPLEVLTFFGLTPDQTVVEILPGAGGYWTEILAPYLKANGHYIAANNEKASTSPDDQKDNAALAAKLAASPQNYDKVEVTEFGADRVAIAPPGSADLVVTFRNVHNWMADGETAGAFAAFYKALKPGGVLGIEEHRGDPSKPQDPLAKSGYVREDVIIGFAEAAGFRFAGSSEINANPKDTKDYPDGVWTLPPALLLKDVDRAHYLAIGESDRAILKFVKP
ncbi:Predicted methyltransferase [Kaistia soli DSM 19436]|uniref:Predicted methyltransferase n=2 Tax=Kaistia TaxID=166953 RepID=A0A1M4WJF8_9HYPH|nr:Predicted methyltransferase [Kaistia soli DSM 19436]